MHCCHVSMVAAVVLFLRKRQNPRKYRAKNFALQVGSQVAGVGELNREA